MPAKRLLVISPGWEQDELIETARGAGYCLYAIDILPQAARPAEAFEGWKSTNGRDFEAALAIARQWRIEYVVSTQCDYGLQLQAFIAENMGLPGPGWKQAQFSANKWLQREACNDLSVVRQPQTYLCYDQSTAKKAAERLDYDAVVKPVDNRGSIGVSFVNAPQQLEAAIWKAIASSLSGMFVVEQRIRGTLFLVEGAAATSLIVGEKTMNGRFAYMNDDILFGMPTQNVRFRRVAEAHEAVCKHMNYHSGSTTGEYMVDGVGDIWLIEAANRAGGVWIGSKVTRAITGEDASARLLQCFAEGAPAARSGQLATWCYLRYLCLDAGRVISIEGDQTWSSMPGYLAHHFWQKTPGCVLPVSDALKRSGVLLTVGTSPEDVKSTAANLLTMLRIEYAEQEAERVAGYC